MLTQCTHPRVARAVVSMFSCTTLASGRAFLNADATIVCWDALHYGYVGAAVVWVFLIPLGVPCFFLWLLHHFRVPQLAALHTDNAWLRAAIQHAWQHGAPQPPVDVRKIDIDSVSDAHLELLHALLVRRVPVEEAADALSAATAAAPAEEAENRDAAAVSLDEPAPSPPPPPKPGLFIRALLQLVRLRAYVTAKLSPGATLHATAAAGGLAADAASASERRAFLLASLLLWCRHSGKVSIPVINWEEQEEEEEEGEAAAEDETGDVDAKALDATAASASRAAALETHAIALATPAAAPPAADGGVTRTRIACADIPRLQARAMKEVGFLFADYHCGSWFWEAVELFRKLILTSILALVQPGSATQVVVGFLVAFACLMLNMRIKPYASQQLNFVNTMAQLNLFFFMFVALLLKVNIDDAAGSDSKFFTVIVGGMSVLPVALPLAIKAFIKLGSFGRGGKDEMGDVADSAVEDAGF
jgi:hypothetical protein